SLLSENRGPKDKLSEFQRIAIIASVTAGFTYRQAADAYGCSSSTVADTLY
ncbi:hypothetical protein LY78DRAFT_622197, partial [Colletotrichum sublineola]